MEKEEKIKIFTKSILQLVYDQRGRARTNKRERRSRDKACIRLQRGTTMQPQAKLYLVNEAQQRAGSADELGPQSARRVHEPPWPW